MKANSFSKVLLMSFFFCALPLLTKAQATEDNITIYVENRVEMKISIKDFDWLRDDSNEIAKQLTGFQKHLSSVEKQFTTDEAELVTYTPDSALIITKIDKQNIFLIQEDQALNTGSRDQAILKLEDMTIRLTTTDLSKISDIQLNDCFLKMVQALPEQTSRSSSLFFQCKDGAVVYLENKTVETNLDAIELSFGTGANLLRNKWIGDLSFQIGLRFYKKGRLEHYPYVSTNLMYEFPSINRVNINTFLNLGYQWKINNRDADISTMGAEFGYLVSRQGDAFEKGTFRFGLNWKPLDGVSFSPQFYFPNRIKNAYPGFRIGIGF